jgi:hypothetical protein
MKNFIDGVPPLADPRLKKYHLLEHSCSALPAAGAAHGRDRVLGAEEHALGVDGHHLVPRISNIMGLIGRGKCRGSLPLRASRPRAH